MVWVVATQAGRLTTQRDREWLFLQLVLEHRHWPAAVETERKRGRDGVTDSYAAETEAPQDLSQRCVIALNMASIMSPLKPHLGHLPMHLYPVSLSVSEYCGWK